MEDPDAKFFGALSLDVSAVPEVWSLAYFDVYFCTRVLALLRWKRWFLGVIGPRCTTAERLAGALEYIFIVSATIARTRAEFQLQDTPIHSTVDCLSEKVRSRVANIEGNIGSFFDLYPDLLPTICVAANLAPSAVSTAMETEDGQKVLLGTKVPRGAALELAIHKAREGFVFGRNCRDLAASLGSNRSRDTNPQEGLYGFEEDVNAIVRAWEGQRPA